MGHRPPRETRDGRALRVAVRVPNWMGDAVFAIPAIRAVSGSAPGTRLALMGPAGTCGLLEVLDGVDGVWPLRRSSWRSRLRAALGVRRWKPDVGLVLPNSFAAALEMRLSGAPVRIGRPTEARGPLLTRQVPYSMPSRTRHLVDEYLDLARALGAAAGGGIPALPVSEEASAAATRLLPGEGGTRVGFVPGAMFGPAKRWPAERYADLGMRLSHAVSDLEVVLFGSSSERFLCESIDARMRSGSSGSRPFASVVLAGRTEIPVLAGCLARCRIVVGNDTGPTHLAAAVGARVIGLYGSTNPVWTGLRGPGHRVVEAQADCSPCYRRRCEEGYSCLRAISVEEVLQACLDVLDARGRETGMKNTLSEGTGT